MLPKAAHQQVMYLKDQGAGPALLGCADCLDRPLCGGLHLPAGAIDSCLAHCTCLPGEQDRCDLACPTRPHYLVKRVREVGGFDLGNLPKAKGHDLLDLPSYIALVHGQSAGQRPFAADFVAIPMSVAITGRGKAVRARTRHELVAATGMRPKIGWVLSGTEDDRFVERIWGVARRHHIFSGMRAAGVVFATSPNFSLYADVPRQDNLHAMKRIAIVWYQMQEAGIPTALHINGRTNQDFVRWAAFVRDQPAVKVVAVEFGTGALPLSDRQRFVERLVQFARDVGRRLSLVMRGAAEVARELTQSFDRVTLLDSTAYQRAVHRRLAFVDGAGRVKYQAVRTNSQRQVAALFANNDRVMRASIDLDAKGMSSRQSTLDLWSSAQPAAKGSGTPADVDAHDETTQMDLFAQ